MKINLKSKKAKIIICIFLILLVILIGLIILKFNRKENYKENFNFFEILLPEQIDNNERYLFYYMDTNYFIKGYNIDDIYIVYNHIGKTISQEVKLKAEENLKNKVYVFNYDSVVYEIISLKEALYTYTININWLENKIVLIKAPINYTLDNIDIEVNKNIKDYKLYSQDNSNYPPIYIKDLEIKNITINGKKYKNIDEINNYNSDILIEQMQNIGKVNAHWSFPNTDPELYDEILLKLNGLDIIIDERIVDGKISYYIHL